MGQTRYQLYISPEKKKKGQTSLLAEQEINTETISNVPETARSFAEVIWTDYMDLS